MAHIPLRRPFATLALLLGVSSLASPAFAVTITQQTETTPHPGVRLQQIRTTSPTTRAWAAFVDLCNDYVHVDATAAPSSLRTTGAWAASAGVQLATNGDFYKTGPIRVYGNAVGGGDAWPASQTGTDTAYASEWYYQNYGWIAFGPDWVDFSHTEYVKKHPGTFDIKEGFRPAEVTHAIPPGTIALVSGFPELVVEGHRVTCSSPTDSSCFPDRGDMRERHPRTAMGLTVDRRTMILLVVDGRTSVSSGMYGTELAELMDKLGAWEAFNLDGGGSSQMWVEGQSYVNNVSGNNSGGSTRTVANHWGVFAGSGHGKSKKPGHCTDYLAGAVLHGTLGHPRSSTDYDGDLSADACMRGPDGVHCAKGAASELGPDETTIGLTDASGWSDLSNYATLRMGDVDGDGKADLCARANARVSCWVSQSAPFDTKIDGPDLSDDSGWGRAQYFSTLRLADINADGLDDLCARGAAGLRCYPSTGTAFGDAIPTTHFADADGFTAADKYGSLRMGDIDGDGTADVCGRGADGVDCYLSDGAGFPTHVSGPAWTDASGWTHPRFFSTIHLIDVDGDGKADLCARSATDFRCHLSDGASFGEPVIKEILTDATGWDDPSNYLTIRMADIDADGDADLCARANAGIRCWPWEGDQFGDVINGPELSDAEGWNQDSKFTTLRMADVNGDRRADVCGLDDDGLFCFPSEGNAFGARIGGPAWSDIGWFHPSVWGTLLLGGPICRPSAEVCNGRDDDCDGVVDEGCQDAGSAGSGGAGGAGGDATDAGWPTTDGSTGGGTGAPGAAPSDADSASGCACSLARRDRTTYAWFGVLLALGCVVRLRRRRNFCL